VSRRRASADRELTAEVAKKVKSRKEKGRRLQE
jgi:hypothetical protein